MLELFPGGFEEVDRSDGVELVAYTDAQGEERMWRSFGRGAAADVGDGWEDRWREFHRPVEVGRLWIGQPWQTRADGAIAVVIDPGRAFGTGAHPTTRLALLLLDGLDRATSRRPMWRSRTSRARSSRRSRRASMRRSTSRRGT
ncbi:MAG: 50S ribosomal protein L11 methyltransferase [Acidobacteria bacterium]|nr:50S ribosomal protein L11 methyltransferase [Acidobacteriota bacterium]